MKKEKWICPDLEVDREAEDLEADRAEAVSEEEDPVDRSVADREDPAGISVAPGWAGDRARLTADRPEDPTTGAVSPGAAAAACLSSASSCSPCSAFSCSRFCSERFCNCPKKPAASSRRLFGCMGCF